MAVFTNFANVTTFTDIMCIPNINTGGWAWFGIVALICMIIFIVLLKFGGETAAITGCLIGFVLSMLLSIVSSPISSYCDAFVDWKWALMFLGALIFLFLYITYSSQQNNI